MDDIHVENNLPIFQQKSEKEMQNNNKHRERMIKSPIEMANFKVSVNRQVAPACEQEIYLCQ